VVVVGEQGLSFLSFLASAPHTTPRRKPLETKDLRFAGRAVDDVSLMISSTYVDFIQIHGIMEGSTGRVMYSMYVCTVGIGVRVYTSERLCRWPSVQVCLSQTRRITTIHTASEKWRFEYAE